MAEVQNPKLIAALNDLIQQTDGDVHKLFLRAVREVWQLDPSVDAATVWQKIKAGDFSYFIKFCLADDSHDDDGERKLIDDLINSSFSFKELTESELTSLLDQVKKLRAQY